MPLHHFITTDILGILAAFCLFAIVVFLPGSAICHLTNVLRFRRRTLAFRIAGSSPLAVAVGPIVSYWIGRFLSLSAVLLGCGALSTVAVYLVVKAIRKVDFGLPSNKIRVFAGMVGIWILFAIGSLADLQLGKRLYLS